MTNVLESESGWVEDGFDDTDEAYRLRVPWHWRLRVWIRNDLERLRIWKG